MNYTSLELSQLFPYVVIENKYGSVYEQLFTSQVNDGKAFAYRGGISLENVLVRQKVADTTLPGICECKLSFTAHNAYAISKLRPLFYWGAEFSLIFGWKKQKNGGVIVLDSKQTAFVVTQFNISGYGTEKLTINIDGVSVFNHCAAMLITNDFLNTIRTKIMNLEPICKLKAGTFADTMNPAQKNNSLVLGNVENPETPNVTEEKEFINPVDDMTYDNETVWGKPVEPMSLQQNSDLRISTYTPIILEENLSDGIVEDYINLKQVLLIFLNLVKDQYSDRYNALAKTSLEFDSLNPAIDKNLGDLLMRKNSVLNRLEVGSNLIGEQDNLLSTINNVLKLLSNDEGMIYPAVDLTLIPALLNHFAMKITVAKIGTVRTVFTNTVSHTINLTDPNNIIKQCSLNSKIAGPELQSWFSTMNFIGTDQNSDEFALPYGTFKIMSLKAFVQAVNSLKGNQTEEIQILPKFIVAVYNAIKEKTYFDDYTEIDIGFDSVICCYKDFIAMPVGEIQEIEKQIIISPKAQEEMEKVIDSFIKAFAIPVPLLGASNNESTTLQSEQDNSSDLVRYKLKMFVEEVQQKKLVQSDRVFMGYLMSGQLTAFGNTKINVLDKIKMNGSGISYFDSLNYFVLDVTDSLRDGIWETQCQIMAAPDTEEFILNIPDGDKDNENTLQQSLEGPLDDLE